MKNCENCDKEHDGTFASGRFCSKKCSRSYSSSIKREERNKKISQSLMGNKLSEDTKSKISNTQKGRTLSENHKRKIATSVKKSYEVNNPQSILDLSKRTVTKVLERMNKGCSRCGWNESTCDIHHIDGRKIPNANNHENLCLLCPNCHRLVHAGKVKKEELINLVEYIGDEWKKHYYWS